MSTTLRRPDHRDVQSPAGVELHLAVWEPTDAAVSRAFLLVHGLASNARLWDGVAHHLSGLGHPVAAVDLRGHGASSKPDTGYDFATICVDLDYVLAFLARDDPRWSAPVVAGQSWGANVVLELAATRPWSVSGAVCVDGGTIELSVPFPEWEACARALAPPRIDSMLPDDLAAYLRGAHPDWPESGIQGTLANFIVNAEGYVEPCLTFERHMEILHHLWEHRPSQLYPSVTVPVLLVAAGPPDGSPPSESKQREIGTAVRVLPKARAQWVPGDHDLHAQYPAEMAVIFDGAVADGFFS